MGQVQPLQVHEEAVQAAHLRVHDRRAEEGHPLSEDSPATVAWWQEAEDGLSSWLVVGPGSPPFTHQAWVRQVALPRPAPGEWAVVNQPPLGPLPDDLAQRLRDPVGEPGALSSMVIGADDEPAGEAPDELYLDCLDAALALVAGRLDNELVREQPRNSGVVALRLRPGVLEIAPALDEEGWLGRSLRVELDAVRLDGEEAGEPDVEFGETTVTLAGRAIALPCAHAIWGAAAAAAAVPVTLPKAWLPGVPDQHISVLLTL